jgi:hypothetical protein
MFYEPQRNVTVLQHSKPGKLHLEATEAFDSCWCSKPLSMPVSTAGAPFLPACNESSTLPHHLWKIGSAGTRPHVEHAACWVGPKFGAKRGQLQVYCTDVLVTT